MHLFLKQKVLDTESSVPKEGLSTKVLFSKPICIQFFFVVVANFLLIVWDAPLCNIKRI